MGCKILQKSHITLTTPLSGIFHWQGGTGEVQPTDQTEVP